jgi:hypothetical protein
MTTSAITSRVAVRGAQGASLRRAAACRAPVRAAAVNTTIRAVGEYHR